MQTIQELLINCASIITALGVTGGIILGIYRWILRQNKQDEEIKKMKEEQCLLTYGILACLDGLEQLGCNHTVPTTKEKINKHLNKQAHGMED